MSLARIAVLSQQQARAWSRLACLSNHVPKRNVQEFPSTRIDNTAHHDHLIVLPEKLDERNNKIVCSPTTPVTEIDFNNITAEEAFRGLSQAICTFQNFLIDFENELTEDRYKNPEDFFKDIEKHLYPVNTSYNITLILMVVKDEQFSFKELNDLIGRYYEVTDKRFTGLFEKTLKKLDPDGNLDQSVKKLTDIYRSLSNCPEGTRAIDDATFYEFKKNLKADKKRFKQNIFMANSLISHTVDDPDILAAVADEYNDCQELHHKERTPLIVTAKTYDKFMKVCPDRFVRRMLWETYNKRCSPKALPRLNTNPFQTAIRVTRRKMAELSGYRSHLEYRLRNTMAQTKENILASLESINEDNKPKLEDRLQELTDYAHDNQFEDLDGVGIQEYDTDYLSHKYTNDILIGINPQELNSYFPLKSVLHGIQKFYADYLSLDLSVNKRANSNNFWSPQVQLLELKRSGQSLGNIIFDPYQDGTRRNSHFICGRVQIKCDGYNNISTRLISAPTKIDPLTQEARLDFREVTRLFRCFNQVVQRLLYNYKYYELNAYGGLEPDVVDLFPYLCNAHLLTNHKILQSMSGRGSQAKPIDSELASRLIKSFYHFRPLAIWRQLYVARFDLELNSGSTSIKNLVEEIYKTYSPFQRFKDNYDYSAMGDIFVGPNDGLMYADLWARQLATSCLAQLEDSDGRLDDDTMKEFYGKFINLLLDPKELRTQPKLVTLFKSGFEPMKSGLGVL